VEETFIATTTHHPTMKFMQLLHQRDALIRQARLANVAFAYLRLRDFTSRISRAGLRGAVTLRGGDPATELPWPELAAEEGSQAAIEEHFLDEDVIELADILAFLHDTNHLGSLSFRLQDLGPRYLPQLRHELEIAHIALDGEESQSGERSRDACWPASETICEMCNCGDR
jgi:hypothetical protein